MNRRLITLLFSSLTIVAALAYCGGSGGGGASDNATIRIIAELPSEAFDEFQSTAQSGGDFPVTRQEITAIKIIIRPTDAPATMEIFPLVKSDSAGGTVFASINLFVPVGPDVGITAVLLDGMGRALFTGSTTIDVFPGLNQAIIGFLAKSCSNGIDDDFNGLIDCADTLSCEGKPCDNSDPLKVCSDGVCELPLILPSPTPSTIPLPAVEKLCANGLDDDNDGLIDCKDTTDCANKLCLTIISNSLGPITNAPTVGICSPNTASCVSSTPSTELNCADGVDNDGDSLTDCADPDCFGTPCAPESLCTDGQDNDLDGNADCNDSDCAGDPACSIIVM